VLGSNPSHPFNQGRFFSAFAPNSIHSGPTQAAAHHRPTLHGMFRRPITLTRTGGHHRRHYEKPNRSPLRSHLVRFQVLPTSKFPCLLRTFTKLEDTRHSSDQGAYMQRVHSLRKAIFCLSCLTRWAYLSQCKNWLYFLIGKARLPFIKPRLKPYKCCIVVSYAVYLIFNTVLFSTFYVKVSIRAHGTPWLLRQVGYVKPTEQNFSSEG